MGKNLRKIRISKGYSQEALSIEANVSVTNIYNIENYIKIVKKETLDSVLKSLEVEMSYDEYEAAVNDKSAKRLGEYEELYKNQICKLKTKVDKRLREAENLLKNEKYEESLKIYLSFSNILGHDSSYLLTCAILYKKVGRYVKSINCCNRILSNDKNNSEAQKIKESSLVSLKELNLLTKDKIKNYTIKDLIENSRISKNKLYHSEIANELCIDVPIQKLNN
ncbi:helix-turn-helix domain-containing protein [Terrisporobacter mayombei]|uniref:HTH cro/C1-type domain-containing protein n=1 Tax=Terrisporobacter mayombei TaxID=1541 RepID=A0ABY9PXI3_9FIRM|nr:helix-turn-helix transcriptional regulator [Terrisporobacter mayombei]MCC3868217.1 helix-turn-helix domain-containing protein [Terrisporobacter mayombei]WMT80357.1 hypothetical protein TEMA_06730 [Terrisporobacter mayombei]